MKNFKKPLAYAQTITQKLENTLIRRDTYHQFFHVTNLNLNCMKPELRRLYLLYGMHTDL